jgi:S-adenosylmethionine:tRNA ribosyltransferase-isomerase
LKTGDFDYYLPSELVAQAPLETRDHSRLLCLARDTRQISHHRFRDLPNLLLPGDVLVVNNSRVIPARLFGWKSGTGARIEVLLLEELRTNRWRVMLRPGRRAPAGTELRLSPNNNDKSSIISKIVDKLDNSSYIAEFEGTRDIRDELGRLGEVPLPPYITRPANRGGINDRERYQTIYAQPAGSVAAPTAGLHFTRELLTELGRRQVSLVAVTLHVGAGTFAPVKTERLADHQMHEEAYDLPVEAVDAIEQARSERRRIIAVGTTSVRVLESVAAANRGRLVAGPGRTSIFLYPPCAFQMVDGLITNFHLPQSTLLMLVSAFAAPGKTSGRETVLRAYAEAIREKYRFFSYGDAMLVS